MKDYIVYKHTSPNGKVYIGITNQKADRRWRGNGQGYRQNEHFSNAIKKYGWENFSHEILYEGLSKEEACELEAQLIEQYQSNKIKYGYNQSSGGEHWNHGEETKNKLREKESALWNDPEYAKHMSDVHKGKGVTGWHHTEETKDKLREIAKQRCQSEEYRKRLSDSAKARTDKEQMSRRSSDAWSKPEIREKYIKAKKGNKNRAKKVECVETGEIFSSTSEAAKSINASRDSIGQVCRGERELSHGFHWRFVDE